MSFEFHPNTFKQLFHIIQQLTVTTAEELNANLVQILIICLRLFTTHLKFLCAVTPNLHRDLLATNEDMKKTVTVQSSASNKEINLSEFATNDELRTWFDTLLMLACSRDGKQQQTVISREASKALIHVLDKYVPTFTDKLSFIHKYIFENKHPILIEQLITELNTNATLLSWIEVLCDNDDNKLEKRAAFNILYSFTDIYLNSSSDMTTQRIQQVLQMFQQLVFVRFLQRQELSTSSLIIKYITHILSHSIDKRAIVNDLLNSILVGLYLMTEIEKQFSLATIQPIFTAILPLTAEFVLQNTANKEMAENNLHYNYWLLGKMSHVLMVGPPQDPLEVKYLDKLKSPLFAGGCERITTQNNQYLLDLFESNITVYSQFNIVDHRQQLSSDHEFLMSVYNNTDQGAQLISKMRMYVKDKQRLLQKSIEQQANGACAALFAVYIKHYRRINLAKYELSRTIDQKPHSKLLSIFEYANRVQTLFATTRGQGGDCNELYEQIKIKTQFLLTSVKESHLIPIVSEETMTNIEEENGLKLKRQSSRRKIEKHAFRLLRHMLQACIRLKKLILTKKKAIEQKQDNESVLNRAIDTYVYGGLSKDGKKLESDELVQCMSRQDERAIIRLITYRFIHTFIEKVFNIDDKNRSLTLLAICLPHLRCTNVEWSYLENISATNIQLKDEIGKVYYLIIKTILFYLLQSTIAQQMISVRTMFSLLNLSYKSTDIYYLHNCKFLEALFTPFVSSVEISDRTISLGAKLIGYNWFRLYVLKLCENFEIEEWKDKNNLVLEQKQEIVFHQLILNQLKGLKQLSSIDTEDKVVKSAECRKDSFNNAAIGWFIKAPAKNDLSSKFEVELCTNQWLMLLLRCAHLYEHVRSLCATVDFIEELLYIYQNSENQATILLALKVLRKLILFLPESTDGTSRTLMKSLLTDILFSIGDNLSSYRMTRDIVTELIYIYRAITSFKSSCLKSFESVERNQLNNVLASLCVLGGYVQPFCLGTVVQVYVGDEINAETQLAVIIDIDTNARNLGTPDALPYLVQYSETNKTEWVIADKLRVDIDVLPPNLLALPIADESIHSLFDALAYFIQIDISTKESLVLLQLKRRSIAALYRLLTSKKLVDIFMQKPYASIIAKLSTSNLFRNNHRQPADLRLSNKRHLEQYCLSLDRCEHLKQILENTNVTSKDESSFINWIDVPFKQDRLTVDLSSTEWKPNASKTDVQLFKRGRSGNDEIKIVPMWSQLSSKWLLEDCGTIHRFPGRTYLISENSAASMTTFIVDNLRLSEGNWYFCIRLMEGSRAQIGWATTGFRPSNTIGIGNDKYSWSFDGSQGTLYSNAEFPFLSEDVRWSMNDVCGCGIKIDCDNIQINYWLNGHFLGTAFSHQSPIGSTTTICDMLPNGRGATYFPGVTLKVNDSSISCCEFIFSPEDMFECPLPNGYKPLLVSTLVHTVAYPYSAYLVGDNVQDYIHRTRSANSSAFLRDFVNGHHLEKATFTFDHHQLILPEESGGFPLTIDYHESLTISFDFRILTKFENVDIVLLTFTTPDIFSIQIPLSKINDETRTAVVFHSNDRQMKIYINNECRTFEIPIMTKFIVQLLPTMTAGIQNLAIWKYALSEEHIRRLFTSGLSYVALDYHRLNTHRKRANTFTFIEKQPHFENDLFVPLSEPFDENKWEKTKNEADNDEWKYFKSINGINQSTIQLVGNKTYLVLDKSSDPWSEYTLILDIFIANFPTKNEQLTLVILNSQSEIYMTHDGQLCLSVGNETNIKSESILKLTEYVRLLISVQEKSIRIYVNGLLELDGSVDGEQLTIKEKRIDLFREHDLTKNTTGDDTLRIECKSITYLNSATVNIDEQMKSSNYSLGTLVTPPYSIVAPSLLLIGYDETSIKSVVEQNITANIQSIDTILREQNDKRREDILSRFDSTIDKEKLKDILQFSEFDTDEKVAALGEIILARWNEIQTSPSLVDITDVSSDKKWFRQAVRHLNIDDSLVEWIRDKSTTIEETDITHQLFDLNRPVQEQAMMRTGLEDQRKKIKKSIQYSHREIVRQQYCESRVGCEHGLISMYAHYTILNMLRVWSNDGSSLFPLEKFGDFTFIVTLLRLLDYHYIYTRLHTDENVDRMSLLVNSILKVETNELLKYHTTTHDKITSEILQHKAPLLYQLQKDVIVQSIQFLSNPSLLFYDYGDESTVIDKQSSIKQPNFNFILKLVNLFVKLLTDKSTIKQNEIDFLVPLLFPVPLINLLFDLFLLSPMHQSKIVILHLFSGQKYQQITTNIPTHSNEFLEFDFSQFSQSFHDLLMVIDVINALTDKTKQTPFPEVFVLQSIVLLDDHLQFTGDDIEKSNSHFDTNADLQLISFMNSSPLMNLLSIEFINSLPTESIPNPAYYKTYPSLWHIPAICIQTRAKLLYQFSMFVAKLVSIVDFSLFPGQSILTDKIRTARAYMLYETKFQLFSRTLDVTTESGDMPTVNFDTVRASAIADHGLHTMFSQAYEQLHKDAHLTFRKQNDRLWRAQYLAMHSNDQGGPYRDSISRICSDICSTQLPLFILCPNGRTNSGLNRDRWIPNVFPLNKPIPNRVKKQYRFIGQLMGMAIRKKHYLDLKFPILLWKQLVREQVTIEDIEAIDMQSFTMINEMEKTIKQSNQSMDIDGDINDLFSSILDELRFEVISSAGQTYELVPDGRKIPITVSNFKEYCTSYREYRLNEFHRQIEFIRQGLYSVVPGYFLSLFTAGELEESVCGKGEMDVELLKRNTSYGGDCTQDSPCIQRFWTVLSEMFTEEQKKLFLKFVWGRCTLPSQDTDFTSKFTINPYDISSGPVDGALPRSHTCAFVLDLPEYSSADIMYNRLNYAITYCASIDGDGNMNEAPTADVNSDWSADEHR
ncbi:unnamed protein product [Didymodactylos carnosus]|uniref:Uncharacterized protein n=1 Tax=Didymodactylos carnosus TaxID=1234261 RepID=A0A813ZJP5_9BILA|nr:unnamed protein product [Didymodactylos carnosus]CAF0899299.1 unnamed protein product [Didymodactylos carnosus]CAF3521874.1 unnamed protein product [Didymodactylos carnosus]CAF3682025.1 unnamed protein product [Didymodactylos carnosus]